MSTSSQQQQSQSQPQCYQLCNSKYTPFQSQRLFCKKGCDSDQKKINQCKNQTCNKLCIKSQSKDQKLWFKFLYRAPTQPGPCLSACMYGCNIRGDQEDV